MDNTSKFNKKAGFYASARPTYAEGFLKKLYSDFGVSDKSVVADIGSGTGIFTRQLLQLGCSVYAVEPNDDMRIEAERELASFKGFHSVNGRAEVTGLNDRSVDFITVAQAFHWFEPVSFKRECARILKPDGKIFLIWNSRDEAAEINVRQYELFGKYCPDFKIPSKDTTKSDKRISDFFDGKFVYAEFENNLLYDMDKFISRGLSSSYSPKYGTAGYTEFVAELGSLFEEFSSDGIVTVPNKTRIYYNK